MNNTKGVQDNYSELMRHNVFNIEGRLIKGNKILKVIEANTSNKLKDLTVLDYGCSTGIIDSVLANEVALLDGIDIDESAIKYAKDYCKDIENVNFATNKQVFWGKKYDVIICNQIYEHVENQMDLVEDLNHFLKEDGIIYFGATNKFILIEPHYKLPLLSWFPKKISNVYIRMFTKHKNYYEDLLSYTDLKKLLSKYFLITDVSLDIVKNYKKYNAEDIFLIRLFSFLPRSILQLLLFFSPNWVWVLNKRENTKRL